jgi:hypothetical protein
MSQPDSHSTLRFGEFELDISAYELRRGGQPVHLERQPMDLLILLVERHRQLVWRADIAKRLWDPGVFVDVEMGVNTAIRKVRQALRDSRESPAFIETLFGSSLPSLLVGQHHQLYSGTGADIVMESIAPIEAEKGEVKAQTCDIGRLCT